MRLSLLLRTPSSTIAPPVGTSQAVVSHSSTLQPNPPAVTVPLQTPIVSEFVTPAAESVATPVTIRIQEKVYVSDTQPSQLTPTVPPRSPSSSTPLPEPTSTSLPKTPTLVPTPNAVAGFGEFILELESPTSVESMVQEASITVVGRTRVDAMVTVNDDTIEPDIEDRFKQEIELKSGTNIIEIVASLAIGEEKSLILAVIYIP